MKKFRLSLLLVLASALFAPSVQAQDWGRLLQGGIELIQSFSISDDQVKAYVSQFIAQSDQTNKVASANSEYTQRLNRIVNGISQVDGQPLNFKVYMTNDINAFACADGSVRVYSGLMDAMTDDEVLGVIGHEIGHVAHHDTRNAMKKALQQAALRDAVASTSSTVAVLTDSQLGQLGEAYLSSKYSRSQESNADDYAYDFLKAQGKNPLVMCMAFNKLKSLESNKSSQNLVSKMFSTHPDTAKRIKKMEKRAKKDGYVYPSQSQTSVSAASSSKSSKSILKTSKSKTR